MACSLHDLRITLDAPQPPTPKEIEALQAIAVHGTIAAAARSLYVSPHMVDAHLGPVRDKSGCRYFNQVIAWAALNGWLLPLWSKRPADLAASKNSQIWRRLYPRLST